MGTAGKLIEVGKPLVAQHVDQTNTGSIEPFNRHLFNQTIKLKSRVMSFGILFREADFGEDPSPLSRSELRKGLPFLCSARLIELLQTADPLIL